MNEIERAIKNRILYHCDERQHFYKLGKGVIDYCVKDIIADLTALCEQEEREKGCDWCRNMGDYDRFEYYRIDSEGHAEVHAHVVVSSIARNCPNCARKLEVERDG